MSKLKRYFKKRSFNNKEIDPDEIFIDAENLPNFDTDQFEGRLEKSIPTKTFVYFGIFCVLIFVLFFSKSVNLQYVNGDKYFDRSENNRLRHTVIFSKRGLIYDRNDKKIAWNVADIENPDFPLRKYINEEGLSTVLGYVKYPAKDKFGFYYSEELSGRDGAEKFFNDYLTGQNGIKIVEIDALGKLQSENSIKSPEDGKNLKLSIDSDLNVKIYEIIKELAGRVGFTGGGAVIMNVNTGEVISMVSFPEYSSQIMSDGDKKEIAKFINDKNKPFLDRIVNGLYTPGSIVKPYMAIGALSENIIDPYKNIFAGEYISIPNPYDPTKPTLFRDWKPHGYVDMRKALAVSSDIYFYTVGGGFGDQKGIGILNIDKYMKLFGFSQAIDSDFFSGLSGTIPTPEWKKETFGEDWRIGNTYHTSIGQYGFQVSPIQVVRAVSSIANGGKLITPSIVYGGEENKKITDLKINLDYLKIVREGMRDGVIKDYGVAKGLNSTNFSVAAKTGTAELGLTKQFVNSWVTGFFPYESPKYAFAIIMERGPVHNTTGAVYVMRQILDWMSIYRPEYLK